MNKVLYYFKAEWKSLLIVTITGFIYNFGLLAGPIYEGKLAQCLLDIFQSQKNFIDMLYLAISYVLVIAFVQVARYLKRLYVRKFANNTNLRMKQILYGNLVYKSKKDFENENIGSVMTKAISDVDACVEGMRKFTTEIFDTGIALFSYIMLLLIYDWKLALVCLIFSPISYFIAEKMKVIVQKSSAAYKESAARLNFATLDRVENSLTYRVYGCENAHAKEYDKYLDDYEKKAVMSNVWVQAMPPLYHVISMIGVIFIIYFGALNVNTGVWNIAMFTTFMACFVKLAIKSSKAAKLFNAVHKAQVSWKRINTLLLPVTKKEEVKVPHLQEISAKELSYENLFSGLSFKAKAGDIIGITGPVACGKSVLGQILIGELNYEGEIILNTDNKMTQLSDFPTDILREYVAYQGHETELFSDTIENNILLGKEAKLDKLLSAVEMSDEVKKMPQGKNSRIGNGGILLSGGQKQRVILARTLAYAKPIIILDDPFSALDKDTEIKVFKNLKELSGDSIIFLISHRLYLFPELDGIIWMNKGNAIFSNHNQLMRDEDLYRELYELQVQENGGREDE